MGDLGERVSPIPSHDEHLLDDQWCACGSQIMFRRRSVMGDRGSGTTFAAWCESDPDHVLPDAVLQEIAELRSVFGP